MAQAMRRQLLECTSKILKQMKLNIHCSKLGSWCMSTRSVTAHVDEVNRELADVFGSPYLDEAPAAADGASQDAIQSLSTRSSHGSSAWPSSSTGSSQPSVVPPASARSATAALPHVFQPAEDAPEFQPALEQLHHCTIQLQEQVRAMSRILQELAQGQQQQQPPPPPPRRLRPLQLQHHEVRINIPADHTVLMSSQPSTPPATAPRPVSFQQPLQQPFTQASNITAASWAYGSAGKYSSSSSSNSAASEEALQEQQDGQHLTHVDSSGRASMVDVSGKTNSSRTASASCIVRLGQPAFDLVKHNAMAKGDVLTLAQVAGIQGAKHTSALIPLCHNIFLSKVDVQLRLLGADEAVAISATAKTVGQTGVEMEALTAAAVAALTVYDMCKAVSKDIEIGELRLDYKEGGKSGTWARDSSSSAD